MISLKSTRLFQSKFKASINQTRNYRSEAGNTWKRFEYEDEELKKYVFSFKSKGLSYYLLGIVPYHPRSKELIEKFSNNFKTRMTYISPIQPNNLKEGEEDDHELRRVPFFSSLNKKYSHYFVNSHRVFINNANVTEESSFAEKLFRYKGATVIRAGRDPVITYDRLLEHSRAWRRRQILLELCNDINKGLDEITKEKKSEIEKMDFDEAFDSAIERTYSLTGDFETAIKVHEPVLHYTSKLKEAQNVIIAGVVDCAHVDLIMSAFEDDLSWANELNSPYYKLNESLNFTYKFYKTVLRNKKKQKISDSNKTTTSDVEQNQNEQPKKETN